MTAYKAVADYISIHPLRGEWDYTFTKRAIKPSISIHPLRGEWDNKAVNLNDLQHISIHPLRGEWDQTGQWTLIGVRYFNPPTPWGVGQV